MTKTFGGGLLDRRHTVALRDFSLALAEGPPVHHRRGRRERQRQDDAGPPPARPPDADGGPGRLPRAGPHGHVAGGAGGPSGARSRPIFQDPYEVYNPFYRVDHVLTDAGRQVPAGHVPRRGPSADRGRASRGGAPPRGDARAIPAPALRRPAPARHGGAGAAAPAARDPGRRARVDGGRLAPRHDPRGAAADDAGPRASPVDLHHARPGDRVPDQREHRRAVPRRGRRGRRRGAGRQGIPGTRTRSSSSARSRCPAPSGRGRPTARRPRRARAPSRALRAASSRTAAPSAMPACRASAPPLYRTETHRVAACFLYQDAPALPPHEMATVFVESSVASRPGSARTPAAP